ncbi:GNAT family N-acetyltransferase [Vibrio viridaestus]|uniref:N-acetyltransferase n=1 Tax=Vibrio viridaestus TaxID=2487322 RepID=A0A3N9TE88_9VIBR|nr:GNAT family protein [Vibrio viridaestus]RQW62164.1 N-acetyltransferase [Vibrio viridaestus]
MLENGFGQKIGQPVANWSQRTFPGDIVLEGKYVRIEPLESNKHTDELYEAYSVAADGRDWTYMFHGPFEAKSMFEEYIKVAEQSIDPKHFAIIDLQSGKALGMFSLMRVDISHGVIEIGNVAFSPMLQRTPASTEAHFLMMQYVFEELGYRRYEWKCDSLNEPSRKAALRLGFYHEGIFRQAVVYKGRTRDTAWFSIIDNEWPKCKFAFIDWLDPTNFDAKAQQIKSLSAIRKGV